MNRTLHYAIAFSIALHGALLFGLSVERRAAMREVPPPPLEARLVEPPAPPASSPAPPLPPSPEPEPAKPPPVALKPKAAPKAKELRKPEPVRPPPPVAMPSEPLPPAPVVEAPAPAPPPPPPVARVEPRPALPGPSAEQIEALTREQYRLQILELARAHNRYPPLARENNWEGQVLVRMEIGTDGRVSLAVQKSSGHPVLDRQAVDMFRRAQAQVAIPPSLRGKALSLQLRAIYNLRDQGSG